MKYKFLLFILAAMVMAACSSSSVAATPTLEGNAPSLPRGGTQHTAS